jgi:hypothetical protein
VGDSEGRDIGLFFFGASMGCEVAIVGITDPPINSGDCCGTIGDAMGLVFITFGVRKGFFIAMDGLGVGCMRGFLFIFGFFTGKGNKGCWFNDNGDKVAGATIVGDSLGLVVGNEVGFVDIGFDVTGDIDLGDLVRGFLVDTGA